MLVTPRAKPREARVQADTPYQSQCSKRKRLARWALLVRTLTVLLVAAGCGASLTEAQRHDLQQRLRTAMAEPVASRDERDQHSRTMVEVADSGALNGLDQEQLRAAIGRGQACRAEICSKNGFRESDWYYEIGVAANDQIKQLPVLIIGFDPRGRAARIWTLKTH
jgi:hypothetical protein